MVSATKSCSSCENESPIRAVFCLKKKTDIRKFEEVEDCFILDFDPDETLNPSPFSASKKSNLSDDSDLSVIAEKGQVACRDYPHPRHLCVKFPFDKTPHQTHCPMCFCFVCDVAAPCTQWTTGIMHCDASENAPRWIILRDWNKKSNLTSKSIPK